MTSPGPQYAKTAATNTLVQGIIASLILGAGTGILQALKLDHFTIGTLLTAVVTSAIASVVAYLHHAYAAPYLRVRRQARRPRTKPPVHRRVARHVKRAVARRAR